MSMKQFALAAMFAALASRGSVSGQCPIHIPTVPIGNAGNAPDPSTGGLYGSVAYPYFIGSTEVTNAQYAAFLNAVAATDTNNLYNTNMAGSFGGIMRDGSAGSYTYTTVSGRANHPVNWVSFWDSTRFANWLHNGQPTGAQSKGTTEEGAYTLTTAGIASNTITRNGNWQWAVASEDEWYKAAFHQPAAQGGDSDDYWQYPTSINTVPTFAQANFGNVIGDITPAGSYPANFSGTFDMGGNVWEWNEAILFGSTRVIRGGSFNVGDDDLRAGNRSFSDPTGENNIIGFRVASLASSPPPLCVGDLNGDNAVNTADLTRFLGRFGTTVPTGTLGDLNCDGAVNTLDLTTFLGRFGGAC
ncbi:MAG: SUMF1/EgtB/PvdO family nonheme iron enzyme [Phycisphaerales bacterium]